MNNTKAATISKALADTNRLAIIEMLTDGEKCACEILKEFQISQPTLSHHMKVLCDCGLVKQKKVGKWCHYTLNRKVLESFQVFISGLECQNQSKGCSCCCK